MAKNALKEEEFVFPEGGIGDFYMEDDEIEALGRLEAEEAYGSSGIATFPDLAERMASYGRHGDDTVAHVETGELIIPKALIEDNPRLRASIFSHLEELGVEDPERYVVGSGANSINPDTGLPEFFFRKIFRGLKKAVKKVTRAVKKVAKKVVKVVKKAAPIIIPLALNALFPGMGAIYQGALGAGIGTLVQGGSLKDAMKSALIGGAMGGAFEGIKGGYAASKAGTSVTEGAMSGISNAAKFSNLTTAGKQLVTGQFGQSGYEKVLADQASTSIPTANVQDQLAGQYADSGQITTDATSNNLQVSEPLKTGSDAGKFLEEQARAFDASGSTTPANSFVSPPKPPGFFESVKGAFTPGDDVGFVEGLGDAFFPGGGSTAEEVLTMNNINPLNATEAQVAMAKDIAAKSAPGMIRTFGPALAAGTGAAAAAGFFTPPPQDDPSIDDVAGPSGVDLYEANKGKYGVGGYQIQDAQGPYEVATMYGNAPGTQYYNPDPFGTARYSTVMPQYVAEGGEIFPRRNGGIMPNEGIPGQDSVRAMLMPGEFVMTTDAVRGLGNGNLKSGINNMYDMMRGLESRGKAMA